MDVRIMEGRAGGSVNQGPRTITTRSGTNDAVPASGAKAPSNATKTERRQMSHTHGQEP